MWEGRLAFLLKNYIEKEFMETFQVLENSMRSQRTSNKNEKKVT